jgi:hypothetical protein
MSGPHGPPLDLELELDVPLDREEPDDPDDPALGPPR